MSDHNNTQNAPEPKRFDLLQVDKEVNPKTGELVDVDKKVEGAKTEKYDVMRIENSDKQTYRNLTGAIEKPLEVEMAFGVNKTSNGRDTSSEIDSRNHKLVHETTKEGGAAVLDTSHGQVNYTIKTNDPSKFDLAVNTKSPVIYSINTDSVTKEQSVAVMSEGHMIANIKFQTPDGKPMAVNPNDINILRPNEAGEYVSAQPNERTAKLLKGPEAHAPETMIAHNETPKVEHHQAHHHHANHHMEQMLAKAGFEKPHSPLPVHDHNGHDNHAPAQAGGKAQNQSVAAAR